MNKPQHAETIEVICKFLIELIIQAYVTRWMALKLIIIFLSLMLIIDTESEKK